MCACVWLLESHSRCCTLLTHFHSILWIYHNLFIQSSVGRLLNRFHFLEFICQVLFFKTFEIWWRLHWICRPVWQLIYLHYRILFMDILYLSIYLLLLKFLALNVFSFLFRGLCISSNFILLALICLSYCRWYLLILFFCLLLGSSWFLCIDSISSNLAKIFLLFLMFISSLLDFFHIESLSENNDCLRYFPFPILTLLISFSCLLYWLMPLSNTMLKRNNSSELHYLIHNLKLKAFKFLQSMIFAVAF